MSILLKKFFPSKLLSWTGIKDTLLWTLITNIIIGTYLTYKIISNKIHVTRRNKLITDWLKIVLEVRVKRKPKSKVCPQLRQFYMEQLSDLFCVDILFSWFLLSIVVTSRNMIVDRALFGCNVSLCQIYLSCSYLHLI